MPRKEKSGSLVSTAPSLSVPSTSRTAEFALEEANGHGGGLELRPMLPCPASQKNLRVDEQGNPIVSGHETTVVGDHGEEWQTFNNFIRTGGFLNSYGMGIPITALFIVGETAGGGLVALPTSIAKAGLPIGVCIVLLSAIMCSISGKMLSWNWSIMMLRYPEYREHTRKPYPEMGRRACGANVGRFVAYSLNFTQFGTAAVFLLLGSRNASETLNLFYGIDLHFCTTIIFTALIVFPLTLLRSPKDFWVPVVIAMITTSGAVVLLIIGSWRDKDACMPPREDFGFSLKSVFTCFGTSMFAYGGHGAFPTIQHDMRRPHLFAAAVDKAFMVICAMYLPVSIVGALVYGNSLQDVVIASIQTNEIRIAVNIFITLHVLLALTIVFNPINQDLEDMLGVPYDFSWKRLAARGGMMAAVVLCAVTVPNFGPLLDLVGGSTITMMALIFPAIFHIFLNVLVEKYGPHEVANETVTFKDIINYVPRQRLITCVIILVFGCLGGVASTYSAVEKLFAAGGVSGRACYAEHLFDFLGMQYEKIVPANMTSSILCCGPYHNVSAHGGICGALENFQGGH